MNTLKKEGIHTAESVKPDTRPSLQTSAVRIVTVKSGGFNENSGTKETKTKQKPQQTTTTTKTKEKKTQPRANEEIRS